MCPGRAAGGPDGIEFSHNEDWKVVGINRLPLLPGILVALNEPRSRYYRVTKAKEASINLLGE